MRIDRNLLARVFGAMALLALVLVPWETGGQGDPSGFKSSLQPDGSWELSWSSEVGVKYELQRSVDTLAWEEVGTKVAVGAVTSLVDDEVSGEARTFWRVIKLGAEDAEPPVVSIIEASYVESGGATALELLVEATDNIGVVGVIYTEGGAELGAATVGADGRWLRVVPLDPADEDPRQFQARAEDAAGNTGFSEVFTFVPEPLLTGLMPIGEDGQPVTRGVLGEDASGKLDPFVYAPGGNGGGSSGAAMQLAFPDGATVVEVDGETFFEFESLVLGFGAGSGLSVDGELGGDKSGVEVLFDGNALEVRLAPGQTGTIPYGDVTVAQLEEAFGLVPGSGIPIKFFDRFPMRLMDGLVTETGIRGARWQLDGLALPLPEFTGEWSDGVFDLLNREEATFPIYGEIPLPGVSDDSAALVVTRARPLTLTLKRDGQVAVEGQGCLVFSNGTRFCVGVKLDDPNYCFSILAESNEVPLLEDLAAVFPEGAASCVPANAGGVPAAEACLPAYADAYHLFAQAALARRPDSAPDDGATLPPAGFDTVSAIADAWSASVKTELTSPLPVGTLSDVAGGLGRAARGAPDLGTAAAYLATLTRLKKAVAAYAAGPFGLEPAVADVQAVIDDAIMTGAAAVAERANDPNAISSIEGLRGAIGQLKRIKANGGIESEDLTKMNQATSAAVVKFFARFVADLNIQDGVLDPAENPVLVSATEDAVYGHVATLNDLLSNLALLGVADSSLDLLNETKRQVFGRGFAAVQGEFANAVTQDDALVGLVAAARYADLVKQWGALKGDPDLSGFPKTEDLEAIADDVAQLVFNDSVIPRPASSVVGMGLKARSLARYAAAVPDEMTGLQPGAERLQGRLALQLLERLPVIPARTDVEGLLELLKAGSSYARLTRQFSGLTDTLEWEATQLAVVVGRLGVLCENALAWGQMRKVEDCLFGELDGAPAASKQKLLQVAGPLLERHRTLALTIWEETKLLRDADPDTDNDGILPGDLKLDRVYGSVCYRRTTRLLSGVFAGQLRMPNFSTALTLENASINSRGEFELKAYGQVGLPGGNPSVVMSVPRKQPLRIAWSRGEGIAFEGKGRLEFSNGVYFEAVAQFTDPLYSMRVEAGGFQTSVTDSLASLIPGEVSLADIQALESGGQWADYYAFLSNCVETPFRSDADVEDPPEGFLPGFAGNDFAADLACVLAAWSSLIQVEAGRGNIALYSETYDPVAEMLVLFDGSLGRGLDAYNTLFPGGANKSETFLLQRVQALVSTYRRASEAVAALEALDQLDEDSKLSSEMLIGLLDNAATQWDSLVTKLKTKPAILGNRVLTKVVTDAGIDLYLSYVELGAEEVAQVELFDVADFYDDAAKAYEATIGLNRTTGAINAAVVGAMSYAQGADALRGFLAVEAAGDSIGLDGPGLVAFIEALTDQMVKRSLENLGFVPAGGGGEGTFQIDGVADATAQRAISQLLEVWAVRLATGVGNVDLASDFDRASTKLYGRLVDSSAALPASRWQARKGFLVTLQEIDTLRGVAGYGPLRGPGFGAEWLKAMTNMTAGDTGRLSEAAIDLLGSMEQLLDDAGLRAGYQARLESALAALSELTDEAWEAGDVRRAASMTEELLTIHELAHVVQGAPVSPTETEVADVLGALLDRVTEVAVAEETARPIATQLAILRGSLTSMGAGSVLRAVVEGEIRDLTNAGRGIALGYQDKIAETDEDDKPTDFKLPGALAVRRVFGSVFYNSDTGVLGGSFGGRLEFPTVNGFFEIAQASLDSSGAFAFDASTQVALTPFESPNLLLSGSIHVVGTEFGLDELKGNGQMVMKVSEDAQGGLQTFNVGIEYAEILEDTDEDPETPMEVVDTVLRFDTAIAEVQDFTDVRFSDDFVLFEGGVKAEYSLHNLGDFLLVVRGKGGLFSKKEALSNPVKSTDFYAFLDIAGLGIRYDEGAVLARVEGGSLTLAEDLFEFLNVDLNPFPVKEPVTIPVPFKFDVGYNFATGGLVFAPVEGQPGQLVADKKKGGEKDEPMPLEFSIPPFGFPVPGLADSEVKLTQCTIRFPIEPWTPDLGLPFRDRLPVLTEIAGTMDFPMPGVDAKDPEVNRKVSIALAGENWRLDAFPEGASLALGTDVRVVDLESFKLDILTGMGEPVGDCPPGLSFSVVPIEGTDPEEFETTISLAGGMRATVDPNLLWDAGEGAGASIGALGCFIWQWGEIPTLSLDTLELGGNFRIGGENGVALKGLRTTGSEQAKIALTDIHNVFEREPDKAFKITIEGALDIANFIEMGLESTAFIWDGQVVNGAGELVPAANNLVPRFEPGGFYGALGEEAIDLAGDVLPFYPTLVGMRFRNPALPMLPAPGQPGLFDITNVIATLSGVVSLPNGAAIEGGSPGIYGSVEALTIGFVFDDELGIYVPDFQNLNLDSLCLQLENMDIPPLGGITGGICVGNLSALPDRPQDLFFAGTLGAKVKDVGASVLLAAKPTEFIGACFELSAGAAGIPLDGGSLGGILLTGGRGGINFKNSFSDPCDFASYITTGSTGLPEEGNFPAEGETGREGNPEPAPNPIVPEGFDGGPITCVSAPFPPPTVNPLCKVHPVTGDIVFKQTDLSKVDAEALLAEIGLSRAEMMGLSPNQIIETVITALTGAVQQEKADAVAFAATFNPPPAALAYYDQLAQELLDSFDDAARTFLRETTQRFLDETIDFDKCLLIDPTFPVADPEFYDLIVCLLQQGMPCFDVTMLLEGTISHSAISTVLSATGGVTLSSTGTAVLDGKINLIGIPVADGTLAFSLTDSTGAINPAFGGLAKVALGPLELGELSMALSCDGCFGVMLNEFGELLACQGGVLTGAAAEFAYEMLDHTFPKLSPHDRGVLLADHFTALTDQQKLAYVGNFFNVFQSIVDGTPLPFVADQQTVDDFLSCFADFIVGVLPQVNPSICFSGRAGPKLFGFSLTGGADNILGSTMLYRRVEEEGVDYQELVVGTEFSPSQLMLSMIMGTYAYAAPAVDQASMGYSLRVPAFEKETVELMLTNPAQFAGDQFSTLMEDAVLSFGYQFQPLGIQMGNGQGRMILPRLSSHPEHPDVEWELPEGPGLPTRAELILAALTRGQMQNPRWRGTSAEVVELFQGIGNPDGYNPTDPGCAAFTVDVTARLLQEDPDLSALAEVDFANDYFPWGGFVGGADASFPNMLATPPPGAQLVQLFTPPGNFDDFLDNWLPNAQRLFADQSAPDPTPGEPGYAYFTGTTCVGQMAFYLPAPNPVGLDWANASPEEFVAQISNGDFLGVVERTLPDSFYPAEQILMSGWLDAPVMGMDVARGLMDYDYDRGCFVFKTETVPGTWLADFVAGELEIEIKAPQYLEGGSAVGGPSERLAALGEGLASLDFSEVEQVIADVQATLPKASMEVSAGVQIPAELEKHLRVGAGAAAEVFAFSPAYDPDYEPANETPYAVAKRRGGFGLRGSFEIGYFPKVGNEVVIEVPDASFAITPQIGIGGYPNVVGNLEVARVQLPGLPELTNGQVAFNNAPDNLGAFVALEGHLEPFSFTLPGLGGKEVELLSFAALSPATTIGGRYEVMRDDSILGGVGTRLLIDPSSASMPFLGQDVAITVYGDEPKPGSYTPFGFSSAAGEPWEATVCLTSATNPSRPPTFAICDPFAPTTSPCSVAFTPGAPICGTIRGVGLQTFELLLEIPQDFAATFFPGQETESTVNFNGASPFVMYVDSGGRFYVDMGDVNDLGLPGAVTGSGRLEFGFSPKGAEADLVVLPSPVAFPATDILETSAATVTVRNDGSADANVVVSVQPAEHFTLVEDGFMLGVGAPEDTRTFDIIFHPQNEGAINGTLTVESNDPVNPVITVPISGTGTTSPKYFQSRDTIAFGDTAVGQTARGSVTIGNSGSAPLVITGVSKTGSSTFTLSPTGGTNLQPGESQLYVVEFTPTGFNDYAGGISVVTVGQGNHTIPLSGTGTESRWLTLLDSRTTGDNSTLNDVLMLDSERGFVVGDGGTLMETANGGRSWSPRQVTLKNLNGISRSVLVNNQVIARYHFEEPPGALQFEDSGPNGYNGSSASPTVAPEVSFEHGQIGNGVSFDGSNDYVDLGAFDVPNDFTISLWVNPAQTGNNQAFLGKNASNGANQLLFGFWGGGYHVNFRGQQWTVGTQQTGWQHLLLSANHSTSTDNTTVTLYRDGSRLGSFTFTGPIGNVGGGKRWSVGQEWDSSTARSDFFEGEIDEVQFFDFILSSTERALLANGEGGQKVVVSGDDGVVFQSENQGRVWHQPYDINVTGWRPNFARFRDYDWNNAAINGSGKILFGGSKDGDRVILQEDLEPGASQFPQDDEYDEVVWDGSTGSGDGEIITDVINVNSSVYASSDDGKLYRVPGASWVRHGSLDLAGAIYDLEPTTFADYVGVGEDGAVFRSLDGGSASVIEHGLTTADLYSVAYTTGSGVAVPELHAVGDGGVYLTSDDVGVNWVARADGMEGNNRGIDVLRSGSTYEAWVVGQGQRIQYRRPTTGAGPFLTLFPGRLDFGFLTVGQSRTLAIELVNRGSKVLQVTDIDLRGAGFSIAQSDVDAVGPGDAVTIYVRYRPAVDSSVDLGLMQIYTNDGLQPFEVPLSGRAATQDWQPRMFAGEGEVTEIYFRTNSDGYALVNSDASASTTLLLSDDAGETWTTGRWGSHGGDVIIRDIDFALDSSKPELGYAGGWVESKGSFQKPLLLMTDDGGASWTDRTPATSQKIVGVSAHPRFSWYCVAVTDGASGDGESWQSNNTGKSWDGPETSSLVDFRGGRVVISPNAAIGSQDAQESYSAVVYSNGTAIHSRNLNIFGSGGRPNNSIPGGPGVPGRIQFTANQQVRGMDFKRDDAINWTISHGWIVGDDGLFRRWYPKTGEDWVPAPNAEVFGTTDLTDVSFAANREDGWIVGESKVFDSQDAGASWDLNFDFGASAALGAVETRGSRLAWVGGSLDGRPALWRYRPAGASNRPVLAANDVELIGTTSVGGKLSKTINLRNIGTANLDLQQLSIRSDDPVSRFRIAPGATGRVKDGSSRKIQVEFEAVPEALDLAALDPEVFLRFENGWDATTFTDHSVNGRNGTVPAELDRQPRIFQDRADGARDRSLRFDGVDDYALMPGLPATLGDEYTFSLWVKPENVDRFRALFGKHAGNGFNYLLCGLSPTGYYFNLRGQIFSGGEVREGWQHLAVTGRRNGSGTVVTFYVDGAVVWEQTLNAVAGSMFGKQWVLGMDWDSSTARTDHFGGCIDDFARFNRVLSAGEIQMLANASPVCGEHRATLVIRSNSEDGERTIDLRANVAEESRLVVIDTEPSGFEVTVDGVVHQTPAAFAVRCTATNANEWVEGSLHTIEAQAEVVVSADGGTDLTYGFESLGGSGAPTQVIRADGTLERITAEYRLKGVDVVAPAPLVAGAQKKNKVGTKGAGDPGFEIGVALEGAPQGPFVRFSGGDLAVAQVASGGGFSVDGELFVSLSRMYGTLETTSVAFPATGAQKFIEIGESSWLVDFEAGEHFLFKASPASLTVLGKDVVPDGQFCIEMEADSSTYLARFSLDEDFRPLPGVFEIKEGQVELAYNGGGSFGFSMDGGIRVLDLPEGGGMPDWAVDQNVSFSVTSPEFDLSLSSLFGGGAPANLFDSDVFEVDWGDVRIVREPAWELELNNLNLRVFNNSVATVSGTAGLDGKLSLAGTIGSANNIRLVSNNRFSLRPATGDTADISLELQTGLNPSLKLDLPALKLYCSASEIPNNSLTIPGFSFDSSGAFDTGKIPLPTWDFDGIELKKPSGGKVRDNYIRLERESDGDIFFDAEAEIVFIPGCPLHDLSLTVDNASLDASLRGKFCVLPEAISLEFNTSGDCQFSASNSGFTIYFGSGCAGYKNNATGICVGICP